MDTIEKINQLAERLQNETYSRMKGESFSEQTASHFSKTKVVVGKKYAKIDIGTSGRLMVEMETGNVFGIKAYGVIHRGKNYGNLDSIDEWNWSGYFPVKK